MILLLNLKLFSVLSIKIFHQMIKKIFMSFKVSQLQTHLLRSYIGLKTTLTILVKFLQRNKDIVLPSGDKYSSVVILDKASDKEKIYGLINDGISKQNYIIEENDSTLAWLKFFQNVIYRNFMNKHEQYKEMRLDMILYLMYLMTWIRYSPVFLQVKHYILILIEFTFEGNLNLFVRNQFSENF